ncbi:MAG: hypothetical protein MUF72_17275 [Elainella sp. Prado103]|jgi:hypothetical protein|nr:hypothetical protein [Elainella sp. Prado103]
MLTSAFQKSPKSHLCSAGSASPIAVPLMVEPLLSRGILSSHSALNRTTAKPSRLQGLWKGQAFGVGVPDHFVVRLKYQGGVKFTGKAEARNSANPSLFLVTSLQGKIVDGALLLKQTGVLNDNFPPNLSPCLRAGRLKISIVQGQISLQGPWQSNQLNCGDSRIRLRKQ